MAEVLRAVVVLLVAGQTAERRQWVLPLGVAAALLAGRFVDALDVTSPSTRLALGLVMVVAGLWRLVGQTDGSEPVAAVVATAMAYGIENGNGRTAIAAAIAGSVVWVLPRQEHRTTTHLFALVLVVAGVGHTVGGVLSV